jgi:hypothetical protein
MYERLLHCTLRRVRQSNHHNAHNTHTHTHTHTHTPTYVLTQYFTVFDDSLVVSSFLIAFLLVFLRFLRLVFGHFAQSAMMVLASFWAAIWYSNLLKFSILLIFLNIVFNGCDE